MSPPPKDEPLRVTFKAGEVIFLEGERSDGLYLLESGEIEVIKGTTVVAVLSGADTFFGEMSFLLGQKRSATLRARTEVKSLRISAASDIQTLVRTIPQRVIQLLRTLASRVDNINFEVRHCESFKEFHRLCFTRARGEGRQDVLQFLEEVEKSTRSSAVQRNFTLIKNYLLSPRIWTLLKDALADTIAHYIKETPATTMVDEYRRGTLDCPVVSWIDFTGEIQGGLALMMGRQIASRIAVTFGVKEDDAMRTEVGREMANQVLGKVKARVQSFSIDLGLPCSLVGPEELEKKLGGKPALAIDLNTTSGALRMVFQITPPT